MRIVETQRTKKRGSNSFERLRKKYFSGWNPNNIAMSGIVPIAVLSSWRNVLPLNQMTVENYITFYICNYINFLQGVRFWWFRSLVLSFTKARCYLIRYIPVCTVLNSNFCTRGFFMCKWNKITTLHYFYPMRIVARRTGRKKNEALIPSSGWEKNLLVVETRTT